MKQFIVYFTTFEGEESSCMVDAYDEFGAILSAHKSNDNIESILKVWEF